MSTPFNPAPTTLAEVSDPAWLSAMLGQSWSGVTVTGVTVVETLVTQATKIRLVLDVEGGGPNVPTTICIKGILTDTGAPKSASIVETLFYRTIADQQPVRVPRCFYAGLSDAGDNGVIVMEDLIVEGATFLSALSPLTPEDAKQTLEMLAALHAAGWNDRPLFDQRFVISFLDMITRTPIMPSEALQELLDGPRGAFLTPDVKDAARLQTGLEALAAQVRGRPLCLIHGDAHAGNVYRDAGGFGLVDWQILQRGEWAQDVAYHLAAVLSPEDRRAHERDLLDHYRARLKAFGGPDLEAGEAWTRYRAGMIYGYYLWSITRKVEPEITNEFVRRLGLAVSELDSFGAVGA